MRRSFVSLGFLLITACDARSGDPPAKPSAAASGSFTITELQAPGDDHPSHGTRIDRVRSAIVTHVDTFDETGRGARGTVYVQDIEAKEPREYGGLGLFGATAVPADLRLAPGDVVDLVGGTYQENREIGTAKFDAPEFLPQVAQAKMEFRFETAPAEPIEINVEDLLTFGTGRKWIGTLVRIRNVTLQGPLGADSAGRVSAVIAGDAEARGTPTVTNELYPLQTADFPQGKTFKSVTGIVTYFFRLHVAPRSRADFEE